MKYRCSFSEMEIVDHTGGSKEAARAFMNAHFDKDKEAHGTYHRVYVDSEHQGKRVFNCRLMKVPSWEIEEV